MEVSATAKRLRISAQKARLVADQVRGKRVGMIVTGGNTDLRWLCGPEDCRRRLA